MNGYDGNKYDVGDRVELHPAMDLWMRGARYGKVVAFEIPSRVVTVVPDMTGKETRVSEGDCRKV